MTRALKKNRVSKKVIKDEKKLEANCLERMLSVCGPDTSMVACKMKIIFEDDSKGVQDVYLPYIERYNMERIFQMENSKLFF